MKEEFTPRPSVLSITHRGVVVHKIRMETGQAIDLIRLLQQARNKAPSDQDMIDLIMASLLHELTQGGV